MAAPVTTASVPAHAGPGLYLRVAVMLFSLTALEVALYELTYGGSAGILGDLRAVFVPVLLLVSAAKFVLVALFYMHLRQDSRLFSGVFGFPLTIAVFIVGALTILMAYERAFARSG